MQSKEEKKLWETCPFSDDAHSGSHFPKEVRVADCTLRDHGPWYSQSPEDSGYTAPRVGVAAGAKLKRYPGFEEAYKEFGKLFRYLPLLVLEAS